MDFTGVLVGDSTGEALEAGKKARFGIAFDFLEFLLGDSIEEAFEVGKASLGIGLDFKGFVIGDTKGEGDDTFAFDILALLRSTGFGFLSTCGLTGDWKDSSSDEMGENGSDRKSGGGGDSVLVELVGWTDLET